MNEHARPSFEDREAAFSGSVMALPAADGQVLRAETVRLAKEYLADEQRSAAIALRAGGRGLACAGALSDAQDAVMRVLYSVATERLLPVHNRTDGERITVCAMGGYGRGTLAPGSDVDVLFLFPHKRSAWGESVAEAMLYMLWDIGGKVGHATRSVEECVREAKADLTVRTALLETRWLCGEAALYEDLVRRFDKDVVQGTAAEFAQAKLLERDERIKRAGNSRYLVEPNVKEGKGGLRDLNTLYWIAKYVYRVRDPEELVAAGLFTLRELELFNRCEEFLWRVRCHMHLVSARAEERLSFDLQRRVAERLNYRARNGMSPVERFMRHYFMVAKDVGDLTAIVCAALEARQDKPKAMLDRFMGPFRRHRAALEGTTDFVVDHGRLTVADTRLFARDPVNLIRLFWLADRHGLPLHPDATRLVTLNLRHITPSLREEKEANRLFVDIVASRNQPEAVLRKMHETGVLGRFVPDFGRIQALMQFSMYHHFTVDEHTLRAVGVLSDLTAGRLKEELPVATELLPGLNNRRALSVALLLHDIGKGRKEDHSAAGARIARSLCPRLGLSEAETDTVVWLIEHHLDFSQVAQHRDLSDPATIQRFAGNVQTLERLRLLLILTVCDIRAVGPGVWNGWKGQLLRALYWETEIVLAGGHSAADRGARVEASQAELRAALPQWTDREFDRYALRHYPAYWLKVDMPRKVAHAALLKRADETSEKLLSTTATDAFRGVTELTVLAIDHPRLLAIITGACAAAGANIVEAQIFTTTDGLALDTIFISRAFERDEDELRRADRVAGHIVRALKGEIKLPEVVARRAAADTVERAFTVVPSVVIDNTLSARQSVVEVTGLDRPGLLYQLTTALGKMNLNIASARIVTFGEKAVDVFYVTDLTGGKIVNPSRQAALRRRMLEALDVEEDAARKVG